MLCVCRVINKEAILTYLAIIRPRTKAKQSEAVKKPGKAAVHGAIQSISRSL